jgi:preprotein translocase subunit Sec63
MPATASRPDLLAYMNAYAVLEVPHSATSGEIRQAYKILAKHHHPDRHAAGSAEQRRATERMAAINAAYQLAREAPLRHHRVSTGARPDEPWDDAELEAAIQRARADRTVAHVMNVVTLAFFLSLPLLLVEWSSSSARPYQATAVLCMVVALSSLIFRHSGVSERAWRMLELIRIFPRA